MFNDKIITMKKKMFVAAMAMLVLASGSLFAQKGAKMPRGEKPEMKIEQKMERLTEELDLTETQSAEMTVILKESQKSKLEIQEKYPELASEKKEMKALKDYKREQFKSILTEEQLKLMKERKKSSSEKKEGGKKGKDAEKKMAKMKSELNLSDDQVAEITKLDAEMESKREAIKKKYPQIEEAKTEVKSLKKATNSKIKEVLSEEQYEKYKTLKKSKKGALGKKSK